MTPILKHHLEERLGLSFRGSAHPVSGGCIHQTWRLDGESPVFLKTNAAAYAEMFAAEAEGLREIAETGAVRVPEVLEAGTFEDMAFLALEFIPLTNRTPAVDALLGAQLAALHRHTSGNGEHGWHRENTIGETPQNNPWTRDWVAFFREYRLRFQLDLARTNGLDLPDGDRLLDSLDAFFLDHTPAPSLLHGDLWSGNAAATANGDPVLFDPAVYYGDRETDIAFSRMFGGFSPTFYEAYEKAWPLHEGSARREPLYRLYHILNHYNLFGGPYGAQASREIRTILSKT